MGNEEEKKTDSNNDEALETLVREQLEGWFTILDSRTVHRFPHYRPYEGQCVVTASDRTLPRGTIAPLKVIHQQTLRRR